MLCDRQEVEDPTAAVVEHHDRGFDARLPVGQQAVHVVVERRGRRVNTKVRPACRRGRPETGRDQPVDPVRAPVCEKAQRPVRRGQEASPGRGPACSRRRRRCSSRAAPPPGRRCTRGSNSSSPSPLEERVDSPARRHGLRRAMRRASSGPAAAPAAPRTTRTAGPGRRARSGRRSRLARSRRRRGRHHLAALAMGGEPRADRLRRDHVADPDHQLRREPSGSARKISVVVRDHVLEACVPQRSCEVGSGRTG